MNGEYCNVGQISEVHGDINDMYDMDGVYFWGHNTSLRIGHEWWRVTGEVKIRPRLRPRPVIIEGLGRVTRSQRMELFSRDRNPTHMGAGCNNTQGRANSRSRSVASCHPCIMR